MSTFAFSLIVIGWRTTLSPDLAAAYKAFEMGTGPSPSSMGSFFYSKDTCVVILIIGNFLTGVGQGILWVAQGEYVGLCATEETKGFYYALYWGCYMMSNIFGNGIGAVMLSLSTGPIFFIGCGVWMLIVAFGHTKMIVPDGKPVAHKTIMQEITGACMAALDKRMMWIDAEILWTGFSISFWATLLLPALIIELNDVKGDNLHHFDSPAKTSKGLMALVFFGVGEITGSQVMGQIIDKFGPVRGSYQNCLNIIVMVIIMEINIHVLKFDVYSFLMTFAWGWLDGSLNIHVNSHLGFQFENVSDAFAVLGILNGLGVFFMQLVQQKLNIDKSPEGIEVYMLCIAAYGLIACTITVWFPYREESKSKSL